MSTTRIQLRGDSAANWTSANPVLADREMGLETDTDKFKVGNGSTAWNSLSYYVEPVNLTGGTNITITDSYNIDLDASIDVTNMSADTIFIGSTNIETSFNSTNLSGGTIYQGSTDIESLYAPITMPYDFIVAASDETTAITTGATKVTFLSPASFTLTGVTASLSTTGSTITTIDVNKDATTIFSTLLTIDANEKDSRTAATPVVISGGTWNKYDEITIDIDVAGTNATGLKLMFEGNRTY